ncbi:4898_t:CDS:2 [Gigaspora margarita]|uniref:4898_t:CDS:1 n=1 Tax=Gigaspora margarita TaxID=4874 RepID=A0ABN7VJA4_GIGMA|nr:4898_t:CDS:2 [Gigaspora margarita]
MSISNYTNKRRVSDNTVTITKVYDSNGSKTSTSDETYKMATKRPSAITPTNNNLATTQHTMLQKKNWVVKKNLTNNTAYEDDSAITPTMMTTQHTQCMKRQINKQYRSDLI